MTDRHPLDGNMIAADRHYGDTPDPPACPSCGGDLPHGADPESDCCKACNTTADALEFCADKAKALARQIGAAARNAGYPDIKHRDIYLGIAHKTLAEIIEMLPSHE